MLTLCKSTILGAAFLAGVAIAANADPTSPSAAGAVANGASGSQSPGRVSRLSHLPLRRRSQTAYHCRRPRITRCHRIL